MVLADALRVQLAEALPAYELGDVLGHGPRAVVLSGRHRTFARDVAIKVLTPARHDDAARFASEAALVASLAHPNLASVHDIVQDGDLHVLVMERLTGGTLAGCAPADACAIVLAVCAGLAHAHLRGVVHRNLKPSNVMFSGGGVVKVTDFGLAMLRGETSVPSTRQGAAAAYMAPEQIAGERSGPGVDVYAAGVILYELLAGTAPASIDAARLDEPMPLRDRAPATPAALADVVARAMARDPAARYPDARAFATAIAGAGAGDWGPGWQRAGGVVSHAGDDAASDDKAPATAAGSGPLAPRARRDRTTPLLERDDELATLTDSLHDGCAGAGTLTFISAPAGMGKTRLVREAVREARARGMTTLTARGEPLEREFAFGVVRQLFEPALMALPAPAREELCGGAAGSAGELLLGAAQPAAPTSEAALGHSLYWLVANLSGRAPLALVLDDAQWADRPSLRALVHLAMRLEELPVAVVVAARPPEPDVPSDLLDRLMHDPIAVALHPRPLSEAAVAAIVGASVEHPEAAFARACHGASGGNPFLARELASALAAAGISPTAANAVRVRTVGPQTVARSVLLRLRSQSPEAGAVARALAILGGGAALGLVARTARLDEQACGRAADALAAIDVLAPGRPLEFAHSIVRAAVYDALAPSERSAGHLVAARMLHADGAGPETVAAHLLQCEPCGDPWVVARLREATASATSVGALEPTIAYMRRALLEPPRADERAEILIALSEGERHQSAWEPAIAALREAIDVAVDAARRMHGARRLASLLLICRRHDEAHELLTRLVAEMRDAEPELAAELELSLSAPVWLDGDRVPELAAAARSARTTGTGADRRERIVLSRQAWVSAMTGDSAAETVALARAALRSGELIAEDGRAHGFEMSVVALALADRFAEATGHLHAAIDSARARGHVGRWGFLSGVAAHVQLLRGRLAEAEQHALHALDTLRRDGLAYPAALDALVDVLLDRGDVAAAWHAHEQLADREALPDPQLLAGLRLAPARLHVAAGDPAAALAILHAVGERQLALGRPNPAWCPWRSTAALAHLALGERDRALLLAEEELELARSFGASRAIGVASRAAGLCRGGDSGPGLLRDGVAALDAAGAELEHARALADLGAMLRRAGERGEPAREPLRRARQIAERVGAQSLAEHAHRELLAAGARPRRTALRGVDALTPSERRVCELAAQGLSNRQIAQALFVTVKTVEGHLAASYRKLDISRKHELAAAMQEG